jgi:hypothetical protein
MKWEEGRELCREKKAHYKNRQLALATTSSDFYQLKLTADYIERRKTKFLKSVTWTI